MPSLSHYIQLGLAVASFIVATALAFTALAISDDHEIAAGVVMVVAQFLLFAGSVLGIDLTFHHYGRTKVDTTSNAGTAR